MAIGAVLGRQGPEGIGMFGQGDVQPNQRIPVEKGKESQHEAGCRMQVTAKSFHETTVITCTLTTQCRWQREIFTIFALSFVR